MQKGEKVITQLDTKSVYTFMESLVTIKDYVQVAKSMGYGALGIMDVDNLYGAYEFIEACQAHNLSPLVGLEIGLKVDNETIPFRMMALSTKGYQNLMKMSTVKMMGKNNWEDVKHLTEGVAVIVPAPFAHEDIPLGLDYFIGVFADTPDQEFSHQMCIRDRIRWIPMSTSKRPPQKI